MSPPVNQGTREARSRTTAETVADALRQEIARGLLQPGQPLRQDELAARFGVSRIPVREALQRLEKDGLVVVHANRGAFVSTLEDADVVEIFDLRVLLETDLLRRTAGSATGVELDRIEEVMLAAERGAAGPDWSRLDGAFHQALYAPARRDRQLSMAMALRTLVQRSIANEALPLSTPDWLNEHRAMLDACRAGDGDEAARILERHLEQARDMVRARLAAPADPIETGSAIYDDAKWRRAMLDIRPNCECCDRDLPNGSPDARICTFECTFCASCADERFGGVCPNCGGDFVPRPSRPAAWLDRYPPQRERVVKEHGECAA